MNLINKRVRHNKFGEGIITEQDSSYVYVKFENIMGAKTFLYPLCFKKSLFLLEAEVAKQVAIEAEIAHKKQEEQEFQKNQKEKEEAEALRLARKKVEGSSKANKTVDIRLFASIEEFCDKYKKDIALEIDYLNKTGGKKQRIFNGQRIEKKGSRYVYTFETGDELNYPEGIQITIHRDMKKSFGTIVGCEDFTVIIASEKNFGDEVDSLEISAEPWYLLEALNERLDEMLISQSPIVNSLVCDGYKNIDYTSCSIIKGKINAIQMSEKQPITFVWGPPGTGKTETLAEIALAHIKQKHRVLMLSYSNVSVDGAIMRVYKKSPNEKPGTIVRYGYARKKELLEHKYLTSYNLAIHNYPALVKERNELIAERKKLSGKEKRYVDISKRLTKIRELLSDKEKECVSRASFVATTVSKAVADRTIYNSDNGFDVVIFDEASMAYIPQIVFSAHLARKHFVCMGDFKQLPPIVQSGESSLLNEDIFQYCGIAKSVELHKRHRWMCLLDTQRRMHPHISDFVSKTMYDGLMHSAEDMETSRYDIIKQTPAPGYAIAFADLSGMMTVCMKTDNKSRVNVLSALISFSLALEAATNNEVGIITPYNAQSRLLHAMARDVAEVTPKLKTISCATVHQFQGSEKDIIIYDAVDCYRMTYPGRLLTLIRNDYANRLFNVAITRAKGKFVGVANIDYLDNKNLSNNLIFKQMIEEQRGKSSCLTGDILSKKRESINESKMSFWENTDGNQRFLKDIAEAKHKIQLEVPDKPVEDDFIIQLSAVLHLAKKKGVEIFFRTENEQNIPSALRSYSIVTKYAVNPLVLIDDKIVWFGMPSSDAEFKVAENVIKTKNRPIIRFEGRHTAVYLSGLIKQGNRQSRLVR